MTCLMILPCTWMQTCLWSCWPVHPVYHHHQPLLHQCRMWDYWNPATIDFFCAVIPAPTCWCRMEDFRNSIPIYFFCIATPAPTHWCRVWEYWNSTLVTVNDNNRCWHGVRQWWCGPSRPLSGCVQDWECTRHLGTCGALTDLWVATQGECVPAECLSRNVITHRLKYVHGGDFTWVEMRRKLPSHSTQVWLYITDR